MVFERVLKGFWSIVIEKGVGIQNTLVERMQHALVSRSVCLSHAFVQFWGWNVRLKIQVRGNSRWRQDSRQHSEAERASPRTNPIKLFTDHQRLTTSVFLNQIVHFVASCERSRPAPSPSGPYGCNTVISFFGDSGRLVAMSIVGLHALRTLHSWYMWHEW